MHGGELEAFPAQMGWNLDLRSAIEHQHIPDVIDDQREALPAMLDADGEIGRLVCCRIMTQAPSKADGRHDLSPQVDETENGVGRERGPP